MVFGIGRGGPLTVLLGLFIYLFIGLGYILVYAIAATCILLKYAYLGIRYLYLQHKAHKQMHGPAEPCAPLPGRPPMPVKSPVEYRNHKEG